MATPLNLERTPPTNHIYLWSDYIELLCLVNPDHIISVADVIDRLVEVADLDIHTSQNNLENDITVYERYDSLEQKAADWFRNLEFRSGVFNTYSIYPFTISADRNTLSRKQKLTTEHKFYIFLLLASNLRCIQKMTSPITRTFELVSHLALKRYLPDFAEVHVFGTSGKSTSKYRGNLWNKLNELANDLRERVQIAENKVSVHDSGDSGLDLVAWLPMNDDACGLLTIFGQCACTEDWKRKKASSSHSEWNKKLTFTAPPCNMVFIPFCFRDSTGDWDTPHDIGQSVVVDRLRFMHLLSKDYSFLESQPIYQEIEQIINSTEGLV